MAKKIMSMTSEEVRRVYGKDEARIMEMAQSAPEEEHDPNPGGKPIARGFAQFRQYINRSGRPRVESRKTKISIRLPEETVARLRTVEGYTTILSDYIMGGLKNGTLNIPRMSP
jgi:hypothetical protein